MVDRPTSESEGNASSSVPGDVIPAHKPPASDSATTISAASTRPESSAAKLPLDEQKTVISKAPPLRDMSPSSMASIRDASKELVGCNLGSFALEEYIGGGGMGSVYRATDTSLDRTVAVKVVGSDRTDEESLLRFRNEAQSAARLDHPNIARVYYVGEENGWNFIVFEFIEGVNLRDLLAHKGPLPLGEAVSYTIQVAEALDHASSREVIHRDIKPSNVLVMRDGTAKLVDMGLARLHDVESTNDDLTASGVTLGTFDYISPEQARDPRDADVRSDIYSLGCTLFFMLTGRPPFPHGTVLQKLLSHSGDLPPDLSQVRTDIDERLAVIVKKMLAKRPEDRYPRPSELIRELLRTADELGIGIPNRTAKVWVAEQPRRPQWLVRQLPILIPLVLLFSIAGAMEWRAHQTTSSLEVIGNTAGSRPLVPTPQGIEQDQPPVSAVPAPSPVEAPPSPLGPGTELERPQSSEPPLPVATDEVPAPDDAPAVMEVVGTADEDVSGTAEPDQVVQEAVDYSHTIIVADADTITPHTAYDVTESLEEALAAVNSGDHPAVGEIQLWFTGRRSFSPLLIDRSRQHQQSLTIKAGQQHHPVLVCAPAASDFGFDANPAVIEIDGGVVGWERVQFEFELPTSSNSTRSSWTLFRLLHVDHLEMTSCVMTISNEGESGGARHMDVSFFDLAETSEFDAMPQSESEEKRKPAAQRVDLKQTIARGQATFLRVDPAIPFSLYWQHGFLATSERLLQVGGAAAEPEDRGRVELWNVTAAMDSGMCQIDMRAANEEGLHQLDLDIDPHHCVFVTSIAVPFAEHRGVTNLNDAMMRYHHIGEHNFYHHTEEIGLQFEPEKIRWRVRSADSQQQHDFLFVPTSASWYDEKAPNLRVGWKTEPPPVDMAAHERLPAQFATARSGDDSTSFGQAGCDLSLLPRPYSDPSLEETPSVFPPE